MSEWWSAASFVGETYGDTAKDKQRAKSTTNMPAPPTILGDFFKTKGYRGSVHGYYFGTGLKGTGYYKTTAEDSGRPATPISLDGMARKTTLSARQLQLIAENRIAALTKKRDMEVQRESEACAAGTPTVTATTLVDTWHASKKSRRRRDKTGKRVRNCRSKAWQQTINKTFTDTPCGKEKLGDRYWTAASDAARAAIGQKHGELADTWWRDIGLWGMDTLNPNSWESGKRVISRSAADYTMLQELKVHGEAKLKSAHNAAKAIGWNLQPTSAQKTAHDKASGGVGVATRRGVGIVDNTESLVPPASPAYRCAGLVG